ncbi:hypothetical protein EJ05DRAFT_393245 [Pseudovirgaria hyperparasitica]|uniref:Uncharacterized protein n=1 Tax=Pseudovirgaria hyperparasitica TaxID=470096 RepID=A0A6A6W4J2_9PEZI|nr:uncharacterized protein EJ05DRAFT_393245 [Pseudovirgaria hyperparasitica]KAF2757533.1 hypothetical protein EJ05DRAFT_393245 [Pseudovirgaria hyperparasitica]
MVLGILTSIAACPAIIGTTEAIRQGQRQSAKERHRGVKSGLVVQCSTRSAAGREINGCEVVLSDNKLYLSVPTDEFPDGQPDDHPFAGYFLPFPERSWGRLGEGFVSTISDDPPQLNWIYVDQDTFEVKYGLRADAEPHIVGPWDVTPVDKRVTLEGWEGFIAVKYGPGEWALYFDKEDDDLKGILDPEMRRKEVELVRKERKQRRPG